MSAPKEWLDIREASKHAGVSVSTFERMIRTLPVPFVRPAGPRGDRRFYRSHIDAALLSHVENNPAA